jgi:hypothetical protein
MVLYDEIVNHFLQINFTETVADHIVILSSTVKEAAYEGHYVTFRVVLHHRVHGGSDTPRIELLLARYWGCVHDASP